jgi:hypothetical protein
MFSTAKQTVAKAKLVFNKKLQTYKVIIAFNVTQRNKKGDLMFPVQKKCDFVSGDITLEDLGRVLNTAKQVLRTGNIVIAD